MDNNTSLYVGIAALAVLIVFQRLRTKKAPASLVLEKVKSGPRIIDVRSPQEFAGPSYPKAKSIPLDTQASRMVDLPKDKSIVLYCASGARSAQAAQMLKKTGFTDVVSAGGLGNMPRKAASRASLGQSRRRSRSPDPRIGSR
jgi:phage shock protein E